MSIRLLPQNLINQIAAGEVVERPASALKELIENAIDAKATKIEITVIDGGKKYLSVTDNGQGMSKEELELAVQRHATSKLPSDDLLDINFLGFRGEALPSIASVAKVELTSRPKGQECAWKICVEGGKKTDLSPVAHPFGTTITVRELFFATPARLKFLKSDLSELLAIKEVINKIALAYPQISFTLNNDKKIALTYPATTDLWERANKVLGKNFKENTIAFHQNYEDITIKGFTGLPTYVRSTSAEQYLFVNGRCIKDKALLGAIRGAYQGLIGHEGYPVIVLYLTVPNQQVDVNVHPAKTEVRFVDAAKIKGIIINTLRDALLNHSNKTATNIGTSVLKKSVPQYTPKVHTVGDNFFKQQLLITEPFSVKTETLKEPETLPDQLPPLGFAKAQLHKTYIIAQNENGIVIVDQHAAHERLTYEKLMSSYQNNIQTQLLLVPEVLELPSDDCTRLLQAQEVLEKMGLVFDSFGESTLVVREIPSLLDKTDIISLMRDIANALKEFNDTLPLTEKIKNICARMACHTSVRAGRILTLDEMNALLRQMEKCGTAGQCIHGRPTYIQLNLNDIEHLFGRK